MDGKVLVIHGSDYPVKFENTNTHICVEDIANNTCVEKFLCESVIGNITEINCSDYPVSIGNENTHICIKDFNKSKCTEKYLC